MANHYKMLAEIEKTDIDKEQLKIWKAQIDEWFRGKIKSKFIINLSPYRYSLDWTINTIKPFFSFWYFQCY